MDYTGLAILLGIILYGAFEYHRREQLHKEAMAYLKRDLEPPAVSDKPQQWKIWTTGAVATLLLLFVLTLFVFTAKAGLEKGGPYLLVASPLTLILLLLLLIVRRDLKALHRATRE